MRIVPLKDVLALSQGEVVPSVRGRVSFVDKVMSGTKKDGSPWSFQKVKLTENGTELALKFWDREPFAQEIRGRTMVVQCGEDKRNGKPIGIEAEDYTSDYRGQSKTERLLKVSDRAVVEYQDGQGASPAAATTQPPAQQQSAAPAASQAPATATPASNGNGHANGHSDVKTIKQTLNKFANLYLHCMMAADYVRGTWEATDPSRKMTPEQFQACVSTMFIAGNKNGLDGITPVGAFKSE